MALLRSAASRLIGASPINSNRIFCHRDGDWVDVAAPRIAHVDSVRPREKRVLTG